MRPRNIVAAVAVAQKRAFGHMQTVAAVARTKAYVRATMAVEIVAARMRVVVVPQGKVVEIHHFAQMNQRMMNCAAAYHHG